MNYVPAAFEFATARTIIFGAGKVKVLGRAARRLGKKALFVTGKNPGRVEPLAEMLRANDIAVELHPVSGEPSVPDIQQGVARAKINACDMVIAAGGGSAIDSAKAVAALLTNPGEVTDYLEIIGDGKPLIHQPAPCIAVPTTAGTGAEVTANSVIGSPEHRVKVSLRHPLMLPDIALVDPELTLSLPRHITAHSGLDAFTQVLEPYVSRMANPLTDLLCREGIHRAAGSLQTVCDDPGNLQAREDMALAGLYGGLALANAKLGAVHGIAGPFGGMYPAPHGAVCAALLPHVMKTNIIALQERAPENRALERYREIAVILTGTTDAEAMAAAEAVAELTAGFNIPGLRHYGYTDREKELLIDKAAGASSMQGNPIELTREEIGRILEAAA